MNETKAVAIVGLGAILPDAPDAQTFWKNVQSGQYSIRDVPPERWNWQDYYDPDHSAPDKTYTRIGGWVTRYDFDPMSWGIPIPPRVLSVMDDAQKWGIAASRQALLDYGYPRRPLDPVRTAVILGNALAGENHYKTTLRIHLPDYLNALEAVPDFQNLPAEVRERIIAGMSAGIRAKIPAITEDTMPGELSNVIAGRIANVFNFSGPNFITDAACASSLAALQAAFEGLLSYKFDAVLTGGVDRSMGPESFVKFSKIGALSPDGSRPYAEGANGFVMGEGGAIFLFKRLADAEKDGDHIYAVVRGIGSSSDGKGKGITAPNPLGQQRAIERAWQDAGLSPATATLIEGHGTSTRVGDTAELNSLAAVFSNLDAPVASIALGSIKSNIGHLKAAAGAAGLLKTVLALDEKILPPSLNCERPNPNIDFAHLPFFVNTAARPWPQPKSHPRRAAISSFGFGGTNFHVVVEEYLPGALEGAKIWNVPAASQAAANPAPVGDPIPAAAAPVSAVADAEIRATVLSLISQQTGYPPEMLDLDLDLEADLGIDTVKQAELFASVRQTFSIPRREDLRLSDYNTLNKVIGFVRDSIDAQAAGSPATGETAPAAPSSAEQPAVDPAAIQATLLALVSGKTGYPTEMLDLDLDLEADLGVDTVKQAELFAAVREHYGIPRREDLRLSDYNTLNKVIGFVRDSLAAQPDGQPAAGGTGTQPAPAATPAAAESTLPGNTAAPDQPVAPPRPLLFLSAETPAGLKAALANAVENARAGTTPPSRLPTRAALALPYRLAMDYENAGDLVRKGEKALKVFDNPTPAAWQALTGQGVYYGSGAPGKIVFMFPGQGSQYANMLRELRDLSPVVAETFREADEVMTPILGRPLSELIFVPNDPESIAQAEVALKDTTVTQPAVLAANIALMRLMNSYGFKPDMVIGHSLGEYAALVAAGTLTFAEALQVVSARGREMTKVSMQDNGAMAAVSAPISEVERVLRTIDGYVVIANINSPLQSVIGGATASVEAAVEAFKAAGFQAVRIPVSHAFHTQIVAPASAPLRSIIARMVIKPPRIPIVANVTGRLYPREREEILDMLANQVASPVQFIEMMQTLYREGARILVEVGPKRVLTALATDNLKEHADVTILFTNHPRKGALPSLNEALCGLLAAGAVPGGPASALQAATEPAHVAAPVVVLDGRQPLTGSVVVSGAGLGLPGRDHPVFDDGNIQRILTGQNMIDPLPEPSRLGMLEKRITRLNKSEAGATLEIITDYDRTIKLAGQRGSFDPAADFGLPQERIDSTDISTQLAIAAGIEALRDAGIPLVMRYKPTSVGTYLPDRWMLPESLADETGVIFGSAFPGLDRMSEEAGRFYEHKSLSDQLNTLRQLLGAAHGAPDLQGELVARIADLESRLQALDYKFDRRFIFRVLNMGHSQFAEYIGARGPNTAVNTACATTTHAVSLAEDWIRAGRARRVVVIAGDDVTSANLAGWIGSGLFASGATTTEGDLRLAALPFDRRRNGLIIGMGAAALVIESEDAVRERGMRGIAEVLASQIGNSAFHGTRLDVSHVREVMDRLVAQAEERFGLKREQMASHTVFVSHETYTPARGGSAAAEIHALRHTFREAANEVVIANTKGFTGHTMAVGIEDVMAVKALETRQVPPIANLDEHFEPDPDLGDLKLSRGGSYAVEYALRLGAGFGSQIAMTLMRRISGTGERTDRPVYQRWLAAQAGYDSADLEVVQRTLRVRHAGPPVHAPVKSSWKNGCGPTLWAQVEGTAQIAGETPVSPALATPVAAPQPQLPAAQPAPSAEKQNAPAPASVSASVNDAGIQATLLALVSEKTGYPSEMLDMNLDLEADLGIDTVKQAELFAAVREHYAIPRREDLRLSDYNTLAKVVGFVRESLAALAAADQPVSPADPPQTAPQAPSAEPSTAPSAQTGEIQATLLALVSEKTGYPTEMLDPDLDLEADLGVDTVKQAELFAAVREHYGIPRREDLRLSDYNTLNKVIGFVRDSLAAPTASQPAEAAPVEEPAPQTPAAHTEPVKENLKPETVPAAPETSPAPNASASQAADLPEARLVARKPVPVLRPRLNLCKSTGVELSAGARVILVMDRGKVGDALARRLRARQVDVLLLRAIDPAAVPAQVEAWLAAGPIQGVYFLPALDPEPPIARLNPAKWRAENERRVLTLYYLMRALPGDPFLVSATRLGGLHAALPAEIPAPLGGAVSGFTKAYSWEHPRTLVKVVDFSRSTPLGDIAAHLYEETLSDPGVVEVGWEGEQRYGISLLELPEPAGDNPLALGPESVYLVTGGSGGISVPIVLDLARNLGGVFYLTGRSTLPDPEDPELALLRGDPAVLKQELARRLAESGQKATPVAVEARRSTLQRAAATLDLLAQVRATGARAEYLSCDVTDPEAVAAAVAAIQQAQGHLDVILHAAGVDHSRQLANKKPEEFEQVFFTKASGLYNLVQAMRALPVPPKAVVSFSSIAARFGNAGQTDYAAANDLLVKLSVALAATFPTTRFLAIDWGAWAEVGMASRGALPEIMARAGIGMLQPAEAAPLVRRELLAGSSGELVLAGALGMLTRQRDRDGGLDLGRANEALTAGDPAHIMLSRATGLDLYHGISLEADLDPASEPFLKDHALNGIPILPGVMGIEGFSEAATHVSSALGAASHGFRVLRLEDVAFLAPFKFYRSEPRRITWFAQVMRQADGLVASVVLESRLALKSRPEEVIQHFRGRVYLEPLASRTPPAQQVEPPHWNGAHTLPAEDVYKLYFHGPAFQVLDAVQLSGECVLGRMRMQLPPTTSTEQPLLSAPLLIELCLQTAGIYEAGKTGVLALPRSIGEVVLYDPRSSGKPVYAIVSPGEDPTGRLSFNARVVDSDGRLYLELKDYQTSPLPYPAETTLIAPIKKLVEG